MRIPARKRLAVLLFTMIMLYCSDAPEIVFPEAGECAIISGRVYPALANGRIYLLGGAGIDSTTIDTNTEMFRFSNVPYGVYYLQVKMPGYGTTETRIQADEPVIGLPDIKLIATPLQVYDVEPENGTFIDSLFLTTGTSNVTDSSIFIRIYFREAMDTASVCGALVVEPEMAGVRCVWVSGANNLQVHIPRKELDGESPVNITIGDDAFDRYGHHLEMDLSLTYPVDTGLGSIVPPPRMLVSKSPGDDEHNVRSGSPVTFWFRELMHEASVENAFHIEPDAVPRFSWNYLDPEHRLTVAFADSLRYGTTYRVTLEAGWMNSDSSLTGSTCSFEFETERAAIKSYSPLNGETGILLTEPLTFTTNFSVDRSNFLSAFRIDPPVDSLQFLFDTRASQVRLDHLPFDSATTYSVVVETTLHVPDGGAIGRAVTFSFRTLSAEDRGGDTVGWKSYPVDKQNEWPVGQGLSITFGRKMDSVAVEAHLTITPQISYYTTWSPFLLSGPGDTDYRLEIKPMHYLRSGTTYTVSIDSGHLSLDGIKNSPIGISFTTVPFRLIGHSPPQGQINAGPSIPIAFTFNMPIDTSTLLGAIRSTPAVTEFTIDSIGIDAQSARWTYRMGHGALLCATTYTIVVDTTVTDLFGTAARNGVSFEFSTGK
jgi:hypothetical protein